MIDLFQEPQSVVIGVLFFVALAIMPKEKNKDKKCLYRVKSERQSTMIGSFIDRMDSKDRAKRDLEYRHRMVCREKDERGRLIKKQAQEISHLLRVIDRLQGELKKQRR